MSEQQNNGSSIERGRTTPAVPEKFDHKGIRFVSPKADTQLSFVRDRIASDSMQQPTVLDLVGIVQCELEDVTDQRDVVMGGKESLKPMGKQLRQIRETFLDAASGQFADITMGDKTDALTYINRHKQRWELIAGNPVTPPDEQDTARANQKIFATLEASVFSPEEQQAKQEDLDKGLEELDAFKNTTETTPDGLKSKDSAQLLIETLDEKNITDEDIAAYYEAVIHDQTQKEKDFHEKHPGTENDMTDELKSKRESAEHAKTVLDQLQLGDPTLLHDLRQWDMTAIQDLTAVLGVIDLHREDIGMKEPFTKHDEKAIGVLDAFAKRIKVQAGMEIVDDEIEFGDV